MPINPENKVVVAVVALLGCGLIAYDYSEWKDVQISDGQMPSSASSVSAAAPKVPAALLVDAIAGKHLFGAPVVAPPNAAATLPETMLQLTLRGVAVSSNEKNSSAMIAGPNGKVVNYMAGKELPGGAVLSRVYKDRVVLEREGSYETLLFAQPKKSIDARVVASAGQDAYVTVPRTVAATGQVQSSRSVESLAARDARITAQMQQQRSSRNHLSLEERLNKLREGTPKK
ncbi:MAG TPA: type II secretion system protein N [Candidatus Acidoferrum sp.]|nr:type II secretion system protein N [Candidatus Acidoferrum sp.]